MLKVVDLFCGAGGFSEGFKQAGFDIVLAVDYNEDALRTHMINHPDADHLLFEIGNPKYDLIEIINTYVDEHGRENIIIIGSPPCQQFSIANTSDNKDEMKGMEMVNEFIRIVEEVQPEYWIGENVPPSKKYIENYSKYLGYILNSANYGVPQKRRRYFFGHYPKPIKTHHKRNYLTIGDIMENNGKTKDMWMDFDELPKVAKKRVLNHKYQSIPPTNFYKIKSKTDTTGVMPAHGDVAYWLITHSANSTYNGNIIKTLKDQCLTVTTRKNFFVTNGVIFRKFTMLELKRIMGFPDDYKFDTKSRTKQIKQLGNAVVPAVSKAIGEAIINGEEVNLKIQTKLDTWC